MRADKRGNEAESSDAVFGDAKDEGRVNEAAKGNSGNRFFDLVEIFFWTSRLVLKALRLGAGDNFGATIDIDNRVAATGDCDSSGVLAPLCSFERSRSLRHSTRD